MSVTTSSARVTGPSVPGLLGESALVRDVAVSQSQPQENPTTEPTASAAPTPRPVGTPPTPQYVHNDKDWTICTI